MTKSSLRNLTFTFLSIGVMLFGTNNGRADITVKVDSTKPWAGYMNWFSTNDTYVGGGAWGLADLRGGFVPTNNPAKLVLQVNTNTYNTNGYWNLADGTPNKRLEANFYVDVGTAFAGNTVNFVGTVDTNNLPVGWTCYAVIKEFAAGYAYLGDTRAALTAGTPFSISRVIPAGNICQYGFLTYGPNAAPGSPASFTAASILVDNADPSITKQPGKARVVVGGTASLTVTAVGGSPLHYQWKRYGTNILNGGRFSGATSATFQISNAQLDDDTSYTVVVSDSSVTPQTSDPARLRVLTPAQFANFADNPSFELDVVDPALVPVPWVNFSGCALQNTNNLYAFNPGSYVQAHDGTNVVQVYNAGQYNGFYQDVPCSPGDVFTGDAWMWQSSLDPLLAPIDEAFLELQFWPVAGAPIAIWQSDKVTNAPAMLDTWLHLFATNGVAAGYASTTTSNSYYCVAPPGTDHCRFQVTLHFEGGGGGSVYVDQMALMKKLPVTVTPTLGGGNITLSWLTQGATSYQVVYKNNLTDATWTPIGSPIPGDGTIKSTSFSSGSGNRFYAVLTL